MKFYCIADEDTVRGFRLAGIEAQIAATAEEARTAIDDVAARPDCGLLSSPKRWQPGFGHR